MSGGGGSSFGTSQIRVAITNLAPCSSKPKVPKNGDDDCIKCDDPSRPDCRDEPLQRALAAVETAAAAEGADLVLLPETFACAGMDMHEMKGYADKQCTTCTLIPAHLLIIKFLQEKAVEATTQNEENIDEGNT